MQDAKALAQQRIAEYQISTVKDQLKTSIELSGLASSETIKLILSYSSLVAQYVSTQLKVQQPDYHSLEEQLLKGSFPSIPPSNSLRNIVTKEPSEDPADLISVLETAGERDDPTLPGAGEDREVPPGPELADKGAERDPDEAGVVFGGELLRLGPAVLPPGAGVGEVRERGAGHEHEPGGGGGDQEEQEGHGEEVFDVDPAVRPVGSPLGGGCKDCTCIYLHLRKPANSATSRTRTRWPRTAWEPSTSSR